MEVSGVERTWRISLIAPVALLLGVLGCQARDEAEPSPDATGAAPTAVPEAAPIDDAMDVALHRPELCERPGDDSVRDVFCADEPPNIQSLRDLQRSLRFGLEPVAIDGSVNGYDSDYTPYVVALSHSTALAGRLVSPLNPRVIMVQFDKNAPTFLAFNRGVQQVELAAFDRGTQRFNFYLLRFAQACNETDAACRPGDLFTPRIESSWQKIALQDAENLKNTPSDCRQCHQRGLAAPMPLMRELQGPWTHFFSSPDQSPLPFPEAMGSDLSRDYLAAKDDEAYGGVPAKVLINTVGIALQNNVSPDQPLLFDGAIILNERWPWSPDGYPERATPSAAWIAGFEAFKRGEQLALPYHGGRATDPDKQATLSEAYRSYREGTLSAEALPDFADIFPDDPQERAEMGLQNEPTASPAQLLIQACGTCHNDVLDQDISRARFNIALGRLAPKERAIAVSRLTRPRGTAGAMPPVDARQLDTDALAALKAYLEQDSRAHEDDELLEHAAQRGMAGPQLRNAATRPQLGGL